MPISTEILKRIEANPNAKTLYLSPRPYAELLRDVYPLLRWPAGHQHDDFFMGLRIVRYMPTGFCRQCGAPIEPDKCSYCRSPSDIIEVI